MVPGITHIFVKNYIEFFLKNLLEMQELTDIISYVLLTIMKENPLVHDDGSSGSGYTIPLNSTTEALFLLSATIDFIGCCLQGLEKIF